MNRREFLQCAAILASGVGMSQVGLSMTAEQHQFMLAAPNFIDEEVDYFTGSQRTLIAAMAEAIIPRTDTPGAIEAGVPRFIELMVARWLNDEEKAIFEAGLHHMETDIPGKYGKPFDALSAGEQLAILEELEASASDSSWYELGNVMRDFNSDAPFICQMKELTVWGFFTSEVGSKEVLRYNPMPMRFDGNFPLSPEDSTWWTNR